PLLGFCRSPPHPASPEETPPRSPTCSLGTGSAFSSIATPPGASPCREHRAPNRVSVLCGGPGFGNVNLGSISAHVARHALIFLARDRSGESRRFASSARRAH